MNYQYNQQPQMPQVPVYVNAEEVKKRKKEGFEEFSGKFADFCRGNKLLATLVGFSDILSYIVTGVCLVMSIVLQAMSTYCPILCLAAVIVAVLPIAKKSILPLAIATSTAALVDVITICFTFGRIASLISLSELLTTSYTSLIIGCVLKIIFILAEMAVLFLPTLLSWQYFAATLPPRAPRPMPTYNQQMPQQDYQQPPMQNYQQPPAQGYQQPPVQNYQQPPVQNYQQPPAQNYQQPPVQSYQQAPPPPQPQAPAGKQCPGCGKLNTADAAFCQGCGTKL